MGRRKGDRAEAERESAGGFRPPLFALSLRGDGLDAAGRREFLSGPSSDQYLNTEKARPVGGFSEMLDMVSQSLSARGTDENFQELNSGDRVTDSATCTDAEEIEASG